MRTAIVPAYEEAAWLLRYLAQASVQSNPEYKVRALTAVILSIDSIGYA